MRKVRMRLSIGAIMVTVVVIAVAIAALREASGTWASVLFTLTLLMLGTAVLGAICRRAAERAFWLGFALFGGTYMALAFMAHVAGEIRPLLASTALLNWAHAKVAEPKAFTFTTQPVGNGVAANWSNVVTTV